MENSNDILEFILRRSSSPREVVEKVGDCDTWWEIILKREDVRDYLRDTFPPNKAKTIARKLKNWDLWGIILSGDKIPPDESIYIVQKEVKFINIKVIVFKRQDVKKYLNEMTPVEAINYAKKFNEYDFWAKIVRRPDVCEYLLKLPLIEALSVIKDAGKDVEDILGSIEPLEEVIFGRNDFQEYLNEMSVSDAIKFLESTHHWNVWNIILGRSDISKEQATSFAQTINHEIVWETVFKKN